MTHTRTTNLSKFCLSTDPDCECRRDCLLTERRSHRARQTTIHMHAEDTRRRNPRLKDPMPIACEADVFVLLRRRAMWRQGHISRPFPSASSQSVRVQEYAFQRTMGGDKPAALLQSSRSRASALASGISTVAAAGGYGHE